MQRLPGTPWVQAFCQPYEIQKNPKFFINRRELMLFELRTYECKPGKREEWVKMMEEEIIPFQVAKGMVIIGSFVVEQDEHTYVWIRRFVDEAEREQLYKAVYETDHWRNDLSPRVGDLLNREAIKVTRLLPTPKSVIQ